MKFLITGGGGYIGVPLIEMLLEKGYETICLDRFFFGKEPLQNINNKNLKLIRDDIRWFDPTILNDIDVVIDLAALSNDPSGELDPVKTYDINYLGRVRVAKLSRDYGVKRYILASTCSVYGFHDIILYEQSPTNPLTTYAKSATLAENDVLQLATKDFTVIAPRFATVYGLAPRMRFDLAINAMALKLFKMGKISVMRDGTQWRPFIHVKDVAKAYELMATCEPELVNGEIFNVGSNEQNYQILPLAKILGRTTEKPFDLEWYGDPDKRSYIVNFDKIKNILGFEPDYSPEDGAKEIYKALENNEVTDTIKTRTVEWYKHLLASKKMMDELLIKDTIL